MKLVLLQPQLRAYDTDHALETIRSILQPLEAAREPADAILLPEHFFFSDSPEEYLAFLRELASRHACHVIGGSHHLRRGGVPVNTGLVVAPDGNVTGSYDKLRPYASERKHVQPGTTLGEFSIGNTRILTLVCADFWFSDLFFRARTVPDLVLVPALSVTRKSSPDYSREMWRHLAITRAYEFGVYVGISDWGYPSELPRLFTCGAGGFADPTGTDPTEFYTAIGDGGLLMVDVDLKRLEAFREDRRERGFFWKNGEQEARS